MPEKFTFPHTEAGLLAAFTLTVTLRAHGFKTRTAERFLPSKSNPELDCRLVTVLAVPPVRNKRAANCAAMLR
jgi:hypothetical protein